MGLHMDCGRILKYLGPAELRKQEFHVESCRWIFRKLEVQRLKSQGNIKERPTQMYSRMEPVHTEWNRQYNYSVCEFQI